MKWSTLATGLLAAHAAAAAASPRVVIPSLEEAAAQLEARTIEDRQSRRQSNVVTTGLAGSGTYPRLEVREMFFNKPNQWTLLILAMQQFQAQSQTDATSYYQIAGIHGVPRMDYNAVGQCSTCSDADGYCTHDSVLFPAWHRTYMALFEQQFMSVVNQIAGQFPAAQQPYMYGAASTMRFPFWDWAAAPRPGYPTLPNIVSQKYVTVNGPTGSQTIINPLFRHDFVDPTDMYYSPFINWHVTLRYPGSNNWDASSQESEAISAFDNIRTSMQDQLYQLFTTCSDYLHFSNDDAGSSSTSCSNSLEGIHNTIHTTAGGPGTATTSGGHMTYLATAAFDPIFWLHHCNVDRLFALWQSQNPSAYGGSQPAPHDTWTIAQGTTQDANSPLTPFLKDGNGNFWTTNEVKDWTTFGYTYPEFSDSDGSQGAIASFINKLYGPSATATAGSSKRTAAPEPANNYRAETTAAPESYNLARQSDPLVAANGSLFQYVANIKSPRYALNGSYQIYLFNGAPSTEDPASWIHDPKLIGPMGVLSQPNKLSHDLIAAGSIPLTRALTASLGSALETLAEAQVIPYLKSFLQWRVAGPAGTAINSATIPGFEVAVFASTASSSGSQYELPKWSSFIPLVEITVNKPGGANTTANTTSTRRMRRRRAEWEGRGDEI
ncbi:hypothetical protein LTR62_002105 [Meristemomyces frigidus]|uniref:tyrosinase n=1 Tax=Meristemomyces frigidus TaxID=1508187 RepID=A0AAN7T7Q9_9PEZI|nr:hypothetical protein LTR62_002105 [Meristemomyces frigidus]